MSDYATRLAATRFSLEGIAARYKPAVFASSLAAEDMVLTDLILTTRLPIGIFTLDTGRLHAETLDMIGRIKARYGTEIAIYRPFEDDVAALVARNGLNGFYDSVDSRIECCRVRKVEPLKRALSGNQAWIAGQRRAQAATRSELAIEEYDRAHGIAKFNPLADWSEDDVWHYIRMHEVPYNMLHDRGYPSIGCEPCTRAIQPGEDIRAGRWWWEGADKKECGLHFDNGKVVRTSAKANVSEAGVK